MYRLVILIVRALALLPLPALRAVGKALGIAVHALAKRRVGIARTNLRLCFPELSEAERSEIARSVIIHFMQAWLDRGWLWHANEATLRARLKVTGNTDALKAKPTILFAPHFFGLDAGWTALNLHAAATGTTCATLYSKQPDPASDAWILAGRQRIASPTVLTHEDGTRALVAAIKRGEPLYFLPDMDYHAREAVFAPFFGVPANTITSMSRLAKVTRAQVIPAITRMTDSGYELHIGKPWPDYPIGDDQADATRMNAELETHINTMRDQYWWVHKRFKTRPVGAASVY
jgi:Kdo2-lipid IVA lauroyltransferase/acyltransferase